LERKAFEVGFTIEKYVKLIIEEEAASSTTIE